MLLRRAQIAKTIQGLPMATIGSNYREESRGQRRCYNWLLISDM